MSSPKPKVASAILVSIAAFMAGPVLFAPAPGLPTPSSSQIPWFVLLAALEAAVFGVAVGFALMGRGAAQRLFSTRLRATIVHAALVWGLGSWWLHDNLHMVNGTDIDGLLAIEYGFHVTVIAAVGAMVWALVAEARDRRA